MVFVVHYVRLYWTVKHKYGGAETQTVDALDTACYDKMIARRYGMKEMR